MKNVWNFWRRFLKRPNPAAKGTPFLSFFTFMFHSFWNAEIMSQLQVDILEQKYRIYWVLSDGLALLSLLWTAFIQNSLCDTIVSGL